MPIAVIMPKLEMSQETALVVEWKKKPGDMVVQGDALLTVETDKLTIDIEAVASGILAGVSAEVGQTVPVTTVIAYLLQPGEDASTIPSSAAVQAAPETPPKAEKITTSATPLAARVAAAEGLDLKEIAGSGPDGKITKADVIARVSGSEAKESAAETAIPGSRLRQTPNCEPHRQPNGWRGKRGWI